MRTGELRHDIKADFLNRLLGRAKIGELRWLRRPDGPVEIRQLWLIVFIVVPIAAATIFIQLNTYPNHDVAWVLWGARELLMGAKWGVDIIEPNPPLAWYLSIPSTVAAIWFGVPLDWTYRILVSSLAALSAGCFAWLLRQTTSRVGVGLLCVTAATCLLLLPGREFGQREHLAILAVFPLLALASRRAESESHFAQTPTIMIGLVAGVGVALKPYFLAVPLLVEVAVQLLSRRRVSLFRNENLALGAAVASYAGFLLIFEQEYLTQVVPLASEIYWSFDLPPMAIWPKLIQALALALPIAAYAIYKRDSLGIVLAASLCGFAASYLIQNKGYGYHLLPVSIISLVLVANFIVKAPRRLLPVAIVALFALAWVNVRPTLAWWDVNRPSGARTADVNRFRQTVATHSPNGRFLIVAVHPYPTFPVSIYTSARQVSRTNSHWFLPAVAQIRAGGATTTDGSAIERHARDFMLHDLAARPGLVLIDTNSRRHTVSPDQFDFLAFFNEDPAFRLAWNSYREIEPIGSFRQFVLKSREAPSKEAGRT